MKRFFSLFLALVTLMLCFFSTGCEKDGAASDSFTITSDYVITQPENASEGEIAAAKKLQSAFTEFTKMTLPISDDYFADVSDIPELEIVVGSCKRPDIKVAVEKASEIGYTIFASGKKLYVYATDDELLDYAVSYLISEYISGKSSVSFSNTLSLVYNHEFKQTDLKINGVEISKYKIVYGNDSYLKDVRHNGKWIESGRYKDVAEALQQEIYLLTKQKLPIVSDASKNEETPYEIIVGWANRSATNDYFRQNKQKYDDYAYGLSGTKLLFAGGSSNACYYAGVAFTNACKAMSGSDFNAPMKTGKADLIKVVCVGDSITDGAGKMDDGSSNDHNVHSYPVYLQKLLGFKYYVANYGHGGQRMMSFATESPNYVPSYQTKPDVVIMMFGTNDANKDKYTPDWGSAAARTRYENAATSMIADYKKANPNVKIFLMTPPSIIRNTTHRSNALLAAQYNREYAAAKGLPIVDIWSISEIEQWVFNDGIHPQGLVYKRFAEVIYENIKDIIVK